MSTTNCRVDRHGLEIEIRYHTPPTGMLVEPSGEGSIFSSPLRGDFLSKRIDFFVLATDVLSKSALRAERISYAAAMVS